MSRKAKIYVKNKFAGILTESSEGQYIFRYDKDYLENPNSKPVSLTLPKRIDSYLSEYLFPFFDGLIPEGWLVDIGAKNWKLNPRDRMGLLLHLCEDCIGDVSVVEYKNDDYL